MSFFEFETIRAAVGGEWIQRPPDTRASREPLAGVGIDTREDLTGRAFVAIRGQRFDGHSFLYQAMERGARLLIVEVRPDAATNSPRSELTPIPPEIPVVRVDDTRRALGRLAQAYRRTFTTTKLIAITGSSGKTTTKRLIDAALATCLQGTCAPKSFNNGIGVPLTILAAKPTDRYVLVEVGTNARGEIARLADIVEPDVAVITSIGRAHLEGLGTIEGVAREKAALLSRVREDGMAIITADAPELRPYVRVAPSTILFGEADDGDLRLTARGQAEGNLWWLEVNDRNRFEVGLPGRHNALNAIAAVAVARRMGVTDQRISAGLASVAPEAMRFHRQSIGGIHVFNDAYNANPESVVAALETFAEIAQPTEGDAFRRIVVLGEMLELGATAADLHGEIGHRILDADQRHRIDHVVLIGPLTQHTARILGDEWTSDRITRVDELTQEALPKVLALFRPGDHVLLKGSRGAALERIAAALELSKAGPSKDARASSSHSEVAPAVQP